MKKAEKIWSKDAPKMKAFLLQEIKETGLAWKTLIEQHLEDYQNGKILDVGCGTGFISLLLAQIGFEVIAIDNNAAMLKEAEKTSEELGFSNKITFMLKDAASMDFPDNTFDAVVSRHAFWLFNNPKKVYAEWYRILKSGGCMLNLDANWLFPFWGEEQAKLFRSDENILKERYGEFQDYYHDTDMMEELKKLPLSYTKRPEWDLKICKQIGFKDIKMEILSQEKYCNPFMALRYRTMPTFLIKAKK
ncbi:class I SAM-dependent methyltransferase [Pseudoramibacter alactolyticus]|uniref:class I SAM-dependent methyltransferase n=1 Tax=Pseudoramibacter alactolyticus TaxID=113287 RepID=UPI0028E4BBBF|nr:class I SAM-dependent methyltransferase [Pseudoramibacter alactolyticus]